MSHSTAFRQPIDSAAPQAAIIDPTLRMHAVVAACALMAHADGEAAPVERRRTFAILREIPAMALFSRDEIADEIAMHEANFRLDPELAQELARERLAPLANDSPAAAQIVGACRALIPADGIAHPGEYRVLSEIKQLLGHEDRPSQTDHTELRRR